MEVESTELIAELEVQEGRRKAPEVSKLKRTVQPSKKSV